MRVPAYPGRKRLCFVMELQGSELSPERIGAEKLYTAWLEHQAEQEPAQQPEDERRRGFLFPGPGDEICRREDDCQQAGFEKQVVPLELKEDATDGRERQIQDPEQDQANT